MASNRMIDESTSRWTMCSPESITLSRSRKTVWNLGITIRKQTIPLSPSSHNVLDSVNNQMQRFASRATVLKRCFASGKELMFGVEVVVVELIHGLGS